MNYIRKPDVINMNKSLTPPLKSEISTQSPDYVKTPVKGHCGSDLLIPLIEIRIIKA